MGASKAAIQLPFMLETVLAVLAGAGLAVLGTWAIVRFGVNQLAQRFQDFRWVDVPDVWAVTPWMVLLGSAVGVIVSWIALVRYVRV